MGEFLHSIQMKVVQLQSKFTAASSLTFFDEQLNVKLISFAVCACCGNGLHASCIIFVFASFLYLHLHYLSVY
jgi:hypothetical protein